MAIARMIVEQSLFYPPSGKDRSKVEATSKQRNKK